jgi:riboflavin kinase / FMN adenylyltransferase
VNSPLHFENLDRVALPAQPLHLAIGMFDGVHRGHQLVIGAAREAAAGSGGLAGVLTYWPHPSRLFQPENPVRLILNRTAKLHLLARFGMDFVIEQEFTREFAGIDARDFLPWLRRHLPRLAGVYVGDNWRFGCKRAGDLALLKAEALAAGMEAVGVPSLVEDGVTVSSSLIRELLVAGKIAEANALLGYSYFSEGVVQPGRQLGRKLGFPTLNLAWEPELAPRYGVYAVSVVDDKGLVQPGVANYGVRPTVEQTSRPLLEVHVLGDTRLGPGSAITVNWLHFLRPEMKFSGVEALAAQIAQDRQDALDFFGKIARG